MQSEMNNSTKLSNSNTSYPEWAYFVLVTVNTGLSFTSTFGNVLFLAALRKSTTLRRPSKVLLCNLAVCNLAIGVFVHPMIIVNAVAYLKWVRQKFPINTLLGIRKPRHAVTSFLVVVSLLNMTAISVDRYLALHLRHRYQTLVTLKKVALFLCALWMAAASLTCVSTYIPGIYNWILIQSTAITIFLCTVSYVTIYFRLRNIQVSQQPNQRQGPQQNFNCASYRKTVTTTLCAYCTFLVCGLPFFFTKLAIFAVKSKSNSFIPSTIIYTVIFLNSSLNPVVYAWRMREIRALEKEILSKFCCSLR